VSSVEPFGRFPDSSRSRYFIDIVRISGRSWRAEISLCAGAEIGFGQKLTSSGLPGYIIATSDNIFPSAGQIGALIGLGFQDGGFAVENLSENVMKALV
jgi:hypothetical protein